MYGTCGVFEGRGDSAVPRPVGVHVQGFAERSCRPGIMVRVTACLAYCLGTNIHAFFDHRNYPIHQRKPTRLPTYTKCQLGQFVSFAAAVSFSVLSVMNPVVGMKSSVRGGYPWGQTIAYTKTCEDSCGRWGQKRFYAQRL